jgi:hypothetical protein
MTTYHISIAETWVSDIVADGSYEECKDVHWAEDIAYEAWSLDC